MVGRLLAGAAALVPLALLTSGCAASHASAAASRPRQPPAVLAVLPEIGRVFLRDNCGGHGAPGHSLGIQIYPSGQSGGARFRAGRLVVSRSLQPGYPATWFPCRDDDVQWLAAIAGGENGAVVGVVRADFGYRRGEPLYSPPRVTVQIYPRRHYYSRDVLLRFLR